MLEFQFETLGQSQKSAEELAKQLKLGDVVALVGDLGAGKTTFTQFLAAALGVSKKDKVLSPSYSIMNTYDLPKGRLVHIDLYRVESEEAAHSLGLEEELANPQVISVVEWGDLFPGLFPLNTKWIHLKRVHSQKTK